MSDDAKRKILARRASFVAAALAGVACGKEPADPRPCLSIAPTATQEPQPCLSVPIIPPPDAGSAQTPAEEAPPQPCLSPMPDPTPTPPPDAGSPPPRPCLSPRAPPTSPPRPCLSQAPPDPPKGSGK